MEQFIGCDSHKKFSGYVAVNEKRFGGEAVRVQHDRQVYREFLARLPAHSVIAAVAAICLATGCSSQKSTPAETLRPVKTMIVTAGSKPTVRSFPGKVGSSKKVELSFQVPGLLLKLPVKEGQRVAKGAMIAQLRQEEFQARLETVQGELDQAQAALAALRLGERPEERLRREAQLRAADARLANARTELDRYARLVKISAVSRSEYELAETAYRVAQEDRKAAVQLVELGASARKEDIDAQEAVVRGLDGRVADAKLQLADSTLCAPYDGVIAERFVEEEQSITANKPVVRFQSANAIDIAVDVPETVMAAGIRSASVAQMVAEISGAPGRQYPVRIQEVAQVADPTTQTFQVRFAMPPPAGVTILPGMTATVTVSYRRPGHAGKRILVPVEAVSKQDTGAQVVWVIGPDQIARPCRVRLGAARDGEIEIVAGLRPGDRIAVAGAAFLRNGMKVRDLGDALGDAQR
jgi:membrane fusion protein, multidrug efflux system